MEEIPKEQVKKLLIANADISWFISLWDLYRQETDAPNFANFMSWLKS